MGLFSSLLTLSLLHYVVLVSGRWETGLDYGEIPGPTPEPLLYRDESELGGILMEISLGGERHGTARRDLALGARQVWDTPWAMSSADAGVSLLAMILATFINVLQNLGLAAPRGFQYVDRFLKHGHCSTLLRRPAAPTHRACAAGLDISASEPVHAVVVAKSAALVPMVRIPTHLQPSAS
jgi:hypothetical protein